MIGPRMLRCHTVYIQEAEATKRAFVLGRLVNVTWWMSYYLIRLDPYLVVMLQIADRGHCSSLNLDYSHMLHLVKMERDCQRDLH